MYIRVPKQVQPTAAKEHPTKAEQVANSKKSKMDMEEELAAEARDGIFWVVVIALFRIRIFFYADPDLGKNLYADLDPGGKGKKWF